MWRFCVPSRTFCLLSAVAAALTCAGPAAAQLVDSSDKVAVTVVPEKFHVAPGGDVPLAVVFDIRNRWHVHRNVIEDAPAALGDVSTLVATKITAAVVEGQGVTVHAGFTQWPQGHEVNVGSQSNPAMYWVFDGKTVVYVPVTVADDAPTGKVTIRVKVTYQACGRNSPFDKSEVCLAPVEDAPIDIELEVVSRDALADRVQGATPAGGDAELFTGFDASIWPRIHSGEKAPDVVKFGLFKWEFEIDVSGGAGLTMLLLLAAVGGLLLNFTPCVLPVIPIKIMSLSQTAGHRGKTLLLGAVMSLGVVAFWLSLGAVIAYTTAQIAAGQADAQGITSTNQLFQKPWFTISVGVVIAVMAIGMCGLFSINLPQWVYRINPKHDSVAGSFGFGIMTAILSTPCTAPFMGAAAAWAATQSWVTTLLTFAAIGAGMALPYLVLSVSPALVKKMPRSGPASELIKQVMGLFMLAAAAYFVGVGLSALLQTPPDPPSRLYWWAVMGFIAAAGAWLAFKTIRIAKAAVPLGVFAALGVLLIAGAVYGGVTLTDKGRIDWVYYTPQRFEQAQKDGKVIALEFTAEWCLNCKWLERNVLQTDGVVAAFAAGDVVPMKVDLTGNNTPGNQKLNDTGRRTIPWLVIIAPDGRETLRSDFYTVDQVVEAVNAARSKASEAASAR